MNVRTIPGKGAITQEPWSDESLGDSAVSFRSQVLRRLVKNPTAVAALIFLLCIGLLALLAPLISRYGPDGMVVVALEFGVGVPIGLIAGYAGGAIDSLLMRMIDVELAVPGLLLRLGVIAVLGPSLDSTVVALGVGGIPFYARMARGMTLAAREQTYVEAARALGCGHGSIIFRHVLRNALDPLLVQATLGLGGAILAASALSYLGVGVQPPTSDWGTLLFNGYEHMFESWSELAFPGLAVSITILSINLFGDGLTDALNPRLGS